MSPVEDELTTPLGQHKVIKPPLRLSRVFLRFIASALGLSLAIFGGWALLVDDPYGGEPTAITSVDMREVAFAAQGANQGGGRSVVAPNPTGVGSSTIVPPPGAKVINIIDGSSGKREQVIIPDLASSAPDEAPPQRRQRVSAQKPR